MSSKCDRPQPRSAAPLSPPTGAHTHSRRSRNELAGSLLSPGLGRFYGRAGRCGAPAEETEVGSWRLRRAPEGEDRDRDRSQHR